jgi:sodium transport system ATP-binding protein
MIKVDGLHKSFGEVKAVRGVSFAAEDGRITGLLGPNGAGKSTTLRILYTVLKPDSGTATIDDIDVLADALKARGRIGTLPHGAGLYPHLTSKGFSQGQRTKVALARSLVHGPQNIILDEPSNGLDVMATRALRDVIRLLKAAGKCVLFSSHVMQEVAALCDEIVIIAEGQVALHDSPDGIRNATGCDDLEDAFVKAIHTVEPAA